MNTILQDIRYALRTLVKNPVFSAVILTALALGIGANSAIFSVVDAVLLQPMPYPDPDRIVRVWELRPNSRDERSMPAFSLDNFRAWRESTQTLQQMAAYTQESLTLTGLEEPVQLEGSRVSPGLFPLLGVQPALGRTFDPAHETPGNDRVIVLSHSAWQRQLGGRDPVGQSLTLNGESYLVLGVMPADFEFPSPDTQFWTPLALQPPSRQANQRRVIAVPVLGRLKPGVSIDQAEAEGTALVQRLREQDPMAEPDTQGGSIQLVTLHEQAAGPVRPALLVLMAAVGFVLLIACANVAHLMLARAARRQKEIAIRAALGAGRGRIIAQTLTESTLLALLGGALGLLLALAGLQILKSLGPVGIPRLEEAGLNWPVLAFTLALSLLTGILFGLAPSLQQGAGDLNQSLKEAGTHSEAGGGRPAMGRLRGFLAVAEIALTLVLLVGAALLISSFVRLSQVDPGYDPDNVLTAQLRLPAARYADTETVSALYDRLLERVNGLPGVESAGLVNFLPLVPARLVIGIAVRGRPMHSQDSEASPMQADVRIVSPGYFQAMSIRLLKGRDFQDRDRAGQPSVVLINDSLARQYFPDQDPLGEQLMGMGEIIGVTADVKPEGMESEPRPQLYICHRQLRPMMARMLNRMSLAVRSSQDLGPLAGAIRSQLKQLDPDLPLYDVAPMASRVSNSVARPRFNAVLLGIFAAVALLLASVGIYGVLSYSVSQRTQETGIRMALGAQGGDILGMVLKQGMLLVTVGVTIGLLASLALTRLISSLLFQVSPTDPSTLGAIALLLSAVALLACWLPARRASSLDPLQALRYE